MAERLKEIFSLLPECESFADVGCDHGYIAEAMLKSGKCKRAVMSDVSEKCLEKAKKLNAEFIKNGVAEAVLSDGLKKVPRTECVLIAGMGGELCYLVEGTERALLIDGLSGVGSLKAFVRELTELPVTMVITGKNIASADEKRGQGARLYRGERV